MKLHPALKRWEKRAGAAADRRDPAVRRYQPSVPAAVHAALRHLRLHPHRHHRAGADAGHHHRWHRPVARLGDGPLGDHPRILWVGGVDIWVAAVAALAVGTLAGVFNAVAIHLSKVNPLVITLGTGFLFGGAAPVLSGLAGATGYEGISNFDPAFVNLANLEIAGPAAARPVPGADRRLHGALAPHSLRPLRVYLIGQNPARRRLCRHAGVPHPGGRLRADRSDGGAVRPDPRLLFRLGPLRFRRDGADAGDHRRGAGRHVDLRRLGHHSRHGAGGAAGRLSADPGLQLVGVSSHVSSALSGGLLVIVVALRSLTEDGSRLVPAPARPEERCGRMTVIRDVGGGRPGKSGAPSPGAVS